MEGELLQAGERLVIRSEPSWLDGVLWEAVGEPWLPISDGHVDVDVLVERDTSAFPVSGWERVTRGAHRRGTACVLENACGSGFDLLVAAEPAARAERHGRLRVVARWRPPRRERLAALVLRSRFHLLVRAVLLQYPPLWNAGRRGRVPLHAAAVEIGTSVPLLVGPGGIGRSTVLLAAARAGGRACSDNVVAGDAHRMFGLVEPMRVEGGGGRRMAHGRRERALPGRTSDLEPDRIVVLRRSNSAEPRVEQIGAAHAARALTAGTYMAGELRRYWGFASTLALGTGIGPAHPPIADTAAAIAARLPAVEITLTSRPTREVTGMLVAPTEATHV
ncbi:hypothetical protein ACQP04_29370 [Pseudonocardia halophobica]|uniref:hypothetical protein n=1 Tax=Pseudonocardia halophobica TaxID=29401 RepID=UPI003D8D18BF